MFSIRHDFLTARQPVLLSAALAFALLALPQVSLAKGSGFPAQTDNNKLASEIQSKLGGKQFKSVQVTVDDNGVATLSGTVDLYEYKADADKQTHKVKGVKAVRNDIQVAGPTLPDQQLQEKLQQEVNYSRVGYGTTAFNAVGVSVHDGEVTLAGHVYDYMDRNAILALVSTTPGVKDLNDEMQVDPTSLMDDQTRLAVARAIYGYPALNKYAVDPVKPIRISVQNGNVSLYGTVDSTADKELAYMRANQVSGVFSVKNYLQVAGQPAEQEKPSH